MTTIDNSGEGNNLEAGVNNNGTGLDGQGAELTTKSEVAEIAEHTPPQGAGEAEHTAPEHAGDAQHVAADVAQPVATGDNGKPASADKPHGNHNGKPKKKKKKNHKEQGKNSKTSIEQQLREKIAQNLHIWLQFTDVAEDRHGNPTGLIAIFMGSVRMFLSLRDIPLGKEAASLLNAGFIEVRVKPFTDLQSVQVSLDFSEEARKRDEAAAYRASKADAAKAKLAAWDSGRKARAALIAAMPPRDTWVDTVVREGYTRNDGSKAWHLVFGGLDDCYLPAKALPPGYDLSNLEPGKTLKARVSFIDTDNLTVSFSLKQPRDNSQPAHADRGSHQGGKHNASNHNQSRDNRNATQSPRDKSFAALPAINTKMKLTVRISKQYGKDHWASFCPAGEGLELYLPSENVPEGLVPAGETLKPGTEIEAWLVDKNRKKKQGTLSLKGPRETPPDGGKPKSERSEHQGGGEHAKSEGKKRLSKGERRRLARERKQAGGGESGNGGAPRQEGHPTNRQESAAPAPAAPAPTERKEGGNGGGNHSAANSSRGHKPDRAPRTATAKGPDTPLVPDEGDYTVDKNGIVIAVKNFHFYHLMGKPAPVKPEPPVKKKKDKQKGKTEAAAPADAEAATAAAGEPPVDGAVAQTVEATPPEAEVQAVAGAVTEPTSEGEHVAAAVEPTEVAEANLEEAGEKAETTSQ